MGGEAAPLLEASDAVLDTDPGPCEHGVEEPVDTAERPVATAAPGRQLDRFDIVLEALKPGVGEDVEPGVVQVHGEVRVAYAVRSWVAPPTSGVAHNRFDEASVTAIVLAVWVLGDATASRLNSADHRRRLSFTTNSLLPAPGMAVATRNGRDLAGVVFHSDRGSQYTSAEFGDLCDRHGVLQSMGATGVCWDNTVAEPFFGTLKREHANKRRWATRADARQDLIRWIEGWHNQRRLHSTIGYNSPVEYEAMFNRNGNNIAA